MENQRLTTGQQLDRTIEDLHVLFDRLTAFDSGNPDAGNRNYRADPAMVRQRLEILKTVKEKLEIANRLIDLSAAKGVAIIEAHD
jgi:hypothetical protein